jgi:hypothetical protein
MFSPAKVHKGACRASQAVRAVSPNRAPVPWVMAAIAVRQLLHVADHGRPVVFVEGWGQILFPPERRATHTWNDVRQPTLTQPRRIGGYERSARRLPSSGRHGIHSTVSDSGHTPRTGWLPLRPAACWKYVKPPRADLTRHAFRSVLSTRANGAGARWPDGAGKPQDRLWRPRTEGSKQGSTGGAGPGTAPSQRGVGRVRTFHHVPRQARQHRCGHSVRQE